MAHVLVVDDTEIVRRALELALTKMGHWTESTSSPLAALDLVRAKPPDLALLDICMPEMDGLSLYKEMCAVLGERRPKVVFISAKSPDNDNVQSVMRQHPSGYVRKPFMLGELIQAVAQALAA